MMTDGVVEQLLRTVRSTEIVGPKTMEAVRSAFPGAALERWINGFEQVVAARIGNGATINFAVASVKLALSHGPETALSTIPIGLDVARRAGLRAASYFFGAAGEAGESIRDQSGFRVWLRTMEELAGLAPESAELVFQKSAAILNVLEPLAFRAWVLGGLRSGGTDPAKRLAYFAQTDTSALKQFDRTAEDIIFTDRERSLRAFLAALWNIHPIIRTAAIRAGAKAPRRSSFDGVMVRIPENYSGFRGETALAHYRAVLAHVGAHVMFTREKFPIGTLKPIQVALVGLMEDARVERLAAREFPGLKRLWLQFHHARPGTAHTAELLMARLSRALIDDDYVDDDPWVNKGRTLFFDHIDQLGSPAMSRKIGGLLGNDLGQMRIQFNAKTYVIEPSYRDDNLGLWDFGEQPPEQSDAVETIIEAVRIKEKDDPDQPEKREQNNPDNPPANQMAKIRALPDDQGIPIASHPEWDHISGVMRNDWTTVKEYLTRPAPSESIDLILQKYSDIENRIARLVGAAKVSRPIRVRRQPQGDRLDLDACIRATIERRCGLSPDARIYETNVMRSRDLSVLLLLDISESTRDRVKDTTTTIIALERAAAALLSEALAGLGDPFAIHAFCSNGREDVHYYRVKDFDESYSTAMRARLAGLRAMLSTRLGAALRQAGRELTDRPTHRKLVLVVTDGEPSDVDVMDKRYLVEDARKAVQQLSHNGIDVFCVGLDSGGESYLPRIFGRRNYLMIDRIEALPATLPMLYFRLTA